MSRNPVLVRDASPQDAPVLVQIWSDFRRTDRHHGQDPVVEAANAVARIAADCDERLLVGVLDDEVVGAISLIRARVSPIHAEMAVVVTHLHVFEDRRRHGVGRALLEAAVSWSEEKDIDSVYVAASVHSRDANRFMARLGLTQIAVIRGASVQALRARLPVEAPACAHTAGRRNRTVGQVLVQRRMQRRALAREE